MNTFAKRLRYAREQTDLTQSALARRVGVKPQAIQAMETGRVRRPRQLLEIAAALHVNIEWLLLGKGPMEILAVQEPMVRYDSGRSAATLSAEAVALAKAWMALPKSQRLAVRETVHALARNKK